MTHKRGEPGDQREALTISAAAQEIKDLFARFGSGDYSPTDAEIETIDRTLPNILRAVVGEVPQSSEDYRVATADGGLDMAEELRSVMRWEEKRMGAVSRGVLKSVIARLEAK